LACSVYFCPMFSFAKKSLFFLLVLGLALGSVWYFFEQTKGQSPRQNPLLILQEELDLAGQINHPEEFQKVEESQWFKNLLADSPWQAWAMKDAFAELGTFSFFTTSSNTEQLIFAIGFTSNTSADEAFQGFLETFNLSGDQHGNSMQVVGETPLYLRFEASCLFISKKEINLSFVEDAPTFFTADMLNPWDEEAHINLWLRGTNEVQDISTLSSAPFAESYCADLFLSENGIKCSALAIHPNKGEYLHGQRRWGKDLSIYLPGDAKNIHIEHAQSSDDLVLQAKARLEARAQLAHYNAQQAAIEQQHALVLEETCLQWSNGSRMRFESRGKQFLALELSDSLAFGNAIAQLPDVELLAEDGHFYIHWSASNLWENTLLPPFDITANWAVLRGDVILFSEEFEDLKAYSRQMDRISAASFGSEESTPISLDLVPQDISASLSSINTSLGQWTKKNFEQAFSSLEMRIDVSDEDRSVVQLSLMEEKREEDEEEVSLRWEYLADYTITSDPTWFRDHRSGGYYALFQDEMNRLIALSDQGKKLWSRELPGQIMGEITQVDLYKNGKYQIIFNTPKAVHCIDILGNNVSGYPINLTSAASSPLAVFDYDKNRNYRFVIGLEDGSTFNFQDEAERTKGWKFKSKGAPIIDLRHIKAGNKDYIFSRDREGDLRLLKRNGEDRFNSKAQIPKNARYLDFFMKEKIENSSMVLCDSSGQVIELVFGDGTAGRMTGLASAEHLLLSDFDEDRLNDLILADSLSLEIFNSARQRILKYRSSSPIGARPQVYRFPNSNVVGLLLAEENTLVFIDEQGNSYFDEVVFGKSMPSIRDANKDGVLDLITHDGRKTILCYKF
jgi:hypothetical protein